MYSVCVTNFARLTSRTEAAVEATQEGILAAGTEEECFSVPMISDEEGAKMSENQEIEDLEKRDFDDVQLTPFFQPFEWI
jgi:hypothetical protein